MAAPSSTCCSSCGGRRQAAAAAAVSGQRRHHHHHSALRLLQRCPAASAAAAAATRAAAAASAGATTPPPPAASSSAALAPPPPAVERQLRQANADWLAAALEAPLRDESTGCSVVLLGVAPFAPLQAELVQQALARLQPAALLLEQPADPGGGELLLPHPAWLQALLDHSDAFGDQQQSPRALAALRAQLAALGHPAARVGRPIVDPFEPLGCYPGLELYRQPSHAADVAQLCGHIPGAELAAAARHAMSTGVPLRCIDAPLKLQAAWVRQMLEGFAPPDEQAANALQPRKELQQLAQLVHPAAAAWELQLAAAAQQLADAAAGGSSAEADEVADVEQRSLLLYLVAKAAAAAMLAPPVLDSALPRMRRLQPLVWRHYDRRTRHMAVQLREAAAELSARAGRRTAAAAAGSQAAEQLQPLTLLAIVGRQHVAGIQQLWRDRSSSLWSDVMPRSFAPSVVERLEVGGGGSGGSGSSDAAAADGGSSAGTAGSAAVEQ